MIDLLTARAVQSKCWNLIGETPLTTGLVQSSIRPGALSNDSHSRHWIGWSLDCLQRPILPLSLRSHCAVDVQQWRHNHLFHDAIASERHRLAGIWRHHFTHSDWRQLNLQSVAPSDGLMSEQFYHMLEVVGTIITSLTGFQWVPEKYQALGQRRGLATLGLVFPSTALETS